MAYYMPNQITEQMMKELIDKSMDNKDMPPLFPQFHVDQAMNVHIPVYRGKRK